MNKRNLQRIFINGVVGLIIGLMIVSELTLDTNQNFNGQNLSTNTKTNQEDNQSPQKTDDFNYLILPFQENLTGVSNWLYDQIRDNSTEQYYMFGATNRSGDKIDKNHYIEDYAVYLDGLISLVFNSQSAPLSSYSYFKESPMYDYASTAKGFYSSMNETWGVSDTTKYFNPNAQFILTFADQLQYIQTSGYYAGAEDIVKEVWLSLNANFYDNNTKAFNYSTSSSLKNVQDQLVAAISGFQIYRAILGNETLTTGIKLDANNTATDLMMWLLGGSGEPPFTNNAFKGGFYQADKSEPIPDSTYLHKELATNAYGIWALVEWYLASGGNTWDQAKLDNATKIYLQLQNLWNTTYSLYMNSASESFASMVDYSISLKNNAIMMVALKYLFEATGNFTYFTRLMNMINGTLNFFRDPIYGTYYKAILPGTPEAIVDQNKSVSTHAYLFRAFRRFSYLSNYVATTLSTNGTTQFVKGEMNTVTANASFYFRLDYLLRQQPVKIIPIPNATYFFVLRYSNDSIILNSTVTGDPTGNATTSLTLDESLPIDIYSISVRINFTGIETKLNMTSFNIIPGFNITYYHFAHDVRAGKSQEYNITLNSIRKADVNTTKIDVYSDCIQNITLINQTIQNQTDTNFTFSIQTLDYVKYGLKNVTLDFWINSTLYLSYTIYFYIIRPIEIMQISAPPYVVTGKNFSFQLNLENYIQNSQLIRVDLINEYLNGTLSQYTLTGSKISTITINSSIIPLAKYGLTKIIFNITRASDGEFISQSEIIMDIRPAVEILIIQLPNSAIHGEEIYVFCRVVNHLDTEENFYYSINNGSFILIKLHPGVNELHLVLSKEILNPYDFGMKVFLLKIKNNENTIIYQMYIPVNIQVSFGSMLLGYILVIAIPIVGIIVFRHLELENKKRLA